jgi:hypothetical protein
MIDDIISPRLVGELVAEKLRATKDPITVLWSCTSEDREKYAMEVSRAGGRGVVPLIIRGVAFDDPNVILQDLALLIEQNKPAFGRFVSEDELGKLERVAIVLVSRVPLRVLQVASPIALPQWFPVAPGETHNIVIEDVTWQINASLGCEELRIDEIGFALYRLEGCIIDRLEMVLSSDLRNGTMSFVALLQKYAGANKPCSEILAGAVRARNAVRNPYHFRPKSTEPSSVIAMLWRIANETPPDGLSKVGRQIADALVVGDHALADPLIAVITRPSNPDTSDAVRGGRALVATVRAACQLTTAAAHADAYGSYPLLVLRALSYDIRTALDLFASDIEDLPDLPLREPHNNFV